ncbi:acyltransferase family protein [Flavobacterium sp. W22_SRS_FK3]|uniref:acyltransferase family protein n=1 Tax=Flavobacterium sp. W22_SRS_FK3 TaxID=3240275 RepID=UPI003F8ED2FE
MNKTTANGRLISLDALRGFVMFWIMSGEHIVHALAKAAPIPVFVWMSSQLNHTEWEGITFYDMIFPIFLFVAGVSMPYSFEKKMNAAGVSTPMELPLQEKKKIYLSMVKRTCILLVLGFIVNGLLRFDGYDQTRFASVLGRIGLAWFFAGLIYLNFDLRKQVFWFAGILIGYYLAMKLIPVPGFGAGVLTKEGSLEGYIDRLFLPGRLHSKVYDPEGLFSTIPAVATALLGMFLGTFIRTSVTFPTHKKLLILLISAIILIGTGLLWNYDFPINKRLWSSSFVCYVGGFSILFFTFFYLIIDVLGFDKWAFPLILTGSNSILIYMASEGMVNFKYTADFVFGGLIKFSPIIWQPVFTTLSVTFVQLLLLYFLYKKKWFLKI